MTAKVLTWIHFANLCS